MNNEISMLNSDLILNASRLLILVSSFNGKKSYSLSFHKLMLYDFFMKYPRTMLYEYLDYKDYEQNFDEYYSFYHWKPDRSKYFSYLNYLISKGLIIRRIEDKKFVFYASEDGLKLTGDLKSKYSEALKKVAEIVSKNISKKSDTAVEEMIMTRIMGSNKFILTKE